MELRNSEAILKDWEPGGSNGAVGAGVGHQVKPRTCKAGGGWVGGNAYSHKPTNTLNDFPQHLGRPLSTGGHTTLPPCGVPIDFV
jgi:hypothetical protein